MRKELIILAAIIVGASAYLFTRNSDKTHYALPQIETVSATDITRIDINGPQNDIQLNKKGGEWTVGAETYPAEEETVKKMLDTLSGLKLTALVSEAENYDRYDLHDNVRITVSAYAGDVLKRQIEVGKAAGTFRHTFVKLADDPRVFHAQDNFRPRFEETLDGLRNKTILSFDKDQITEIRFTKDGKTIVIAKTAAETKPEEEQKSEDGAAGAKTGEPVWKKGNDEQIETGKMNSLLNTLSNLECSSFIYDLNKTDLADPIYTFQAKGSDAEYTLSIFKKVDEESDYSAASSQNDSAFMLSGWQVDEILENLDAKPEEKPEEPTENGTPVSKENSGS